MKNPLSKRCLEPLQSKVIKYARVLLKGRFTERAQGRVVQTISNAEGLRQLKVGSLFCEFRTRRIKWLQSMVRHPQEHAQVLGALLGQVKCESEPKDCVGG
eukprot:2799062-Pyramimonas_sp.AAC.1